MRPVQPVDGYTKVAYGLCSKFDYALIAMLFLERCCCDVAELCCSSDAHVVIKHLCYSEVAVSLPCCVSAAESYLAQTVLSKATIQ